MTFRHNTRRYSSEEYMQMNYAVLEALMVEYSEKRGFDFEAADERAIHNITEQRYNPDTGQLYTPFGGYPLRKKMEENGPIERIMLTRKHLFSKARRTIRDVMRTVRAQNQEEPQSKEEEASRFWEICSQIRDLYMMPFRWERSGPDDRGSAWFEECRKSELYKAARTQQNIEAYGKEGKELFDWMVEEMEARSEEEDPMIKDVFGEVNGGN